MLPAARGNDLWSFRRLQSLLYVRTCGTFMSDADIVAHEKYFQAHKPVVKASFAAATTLNVNHPA